MKTIVTIFILFFIKLTFSQKIVVIDSISNKKIPYAIIKYKNHIVYTNENGETNIKLKNNLEKVKLAIEAFGYTNKFLSINPKKGYKIKLQPKTTELDTIIISVNKKHKRKIIKLNKTPRSFNNFPLIPKSEILLYLIPKNEKLKNHFIESFKITSHKYLKSLNKYLNKKHKREIPYKSYGIIRLNIYQLIDNDSLSIIFQSKPKKILTGIKSEILFKIKKKINFISTGLVFGIEFIKKNENNRDYFRLNLTDKKHKDLNLNTVFINKENGKKYLITKKSKRNLSFEITYY